MSITAVSLHEGEVIAFCANRRHQAMPLVRHVTDNVHIAVVTSRIRQAFLPGR